MTHESITEELKTRFGDAILEADTPFDLLTLAITKDELLNILAYLKDHKTWQFIFLTDITAIHFPDLPGHEFCVVYHLHSLVNNVRLRLKVYLPATNPAIPTAVNLWSSANWMERETYDFFGIIFDGHPNLRKILNIEEQDYFPMRKEYPLEDQTRRDKDDAMFGRDRNDDQLEKLRQLNAQN